MTYVFYATNSTFNDKAYADILNSIGVSAKACTYPLKGVILNKDEYLSAIKNIGFARLPIMIYNNHRFVVNLKGIQE